MAKTNEAERLSELTQIERSFWESAILPAGMDEAGRGPLAGPVVAGCVILTPEILIEGINDSKKLSPRKREMLFERILELSPGYGVGIVSEKIIDSINIHNAVKLAYKEAYADMNKPVSDILVDALKDLDIPARQHSFIKGDAISYLIGAASIVAKVTRDKIMCEYAKTYPQYGFERNKGYGTFEHIKAIERFGPCPIHRRSFIKKISGSGL
ncbi:MAG: Ribonuclease HII [Firmicutes bacterium ADurb.Bin182]|nr:MAG: Ribonuclease HII [Firmicutes bacterium ADurb.Bin182]